LACLPETYSAKWSAVFQKPLDIVCTDEAFRFRLTRAAKLRALLDRKQGREICKHPAISSNFAFFGVRAYVFTIRKRTRAHYFPRHFGGPHTADLDRARIPRIRAKPRTSCAPAARRARAPSHRPRYLRSRPSRYWIWLESGSGDCVLPSSGHTESQRAESPCRTQSASLPVSAAAGFWRTPFRWYRSDRNY